MKEEKRKITERERGKRERKREPFNESDLKNIFH